MRNAVKASVNEQGVGAGVCALAECRASVGASFSLIQHCCLRLWELGWLFKACFGPAGKVRWFSATHYCLLANHRVAKSAPLCIEEQGFNA